MADIGRVNTLRITRTAPQGVYLDGGESGEILLPAQQVPEPCRPGDALEVFVYVNKEKNLQATTQRPHATVGQLARLRVAATSSAGTYLDWGLPKDLLVPLREQQVKMEEGKSYVVFVFLDEDTMSIAASSKLDRFIDVRNPDYQVGEEVDLFLCAKTDLGYRAAVNDAHWGLIYDNEIFQDLHVGQRLKGYIKAVREDARIDISLQRSGYKKVDDVARGILEKMEGSGGRLAVTAKSPPEDIYAMFGVSKKVFKMAIGALYKKRLITIEAEGIALAEKG
ncbi:MAG TPA: S1-like domain-containing RNA-binding protein [Deferrisomatales bacterium]|nr:S1-like domain-containing RNA-binding protein [Deferrisomatales bacterium]